MSYVPVIHGGRLAANSFFSNFGVELLIEDPVPVSAGKLWFNSTEKAFKFSGLNASGAVIVRTFKDAESAAAELAALGSALRGELADEAQGRMDGDAATLASAKSYTDAAEVSAKAYADAVKSQILGGMPAELLDTIQEIATTLQNNPDVISALQSSITANATAIAAETVRATAAEGVLTTGLADEVARATAAEAAEKARAEAAELALGDRLTTVEGQVNGKVGTLASLTTESKTDLVSAINEVDGNADQALSLAAGLRTDLQSEIARAQSAELAEATRATAAEQDLASGIQTVAAGLSSEISRATAAEATELARATAAEGVLTAAVAKEVTDRAAAVSGVVAAYNATVFTYQSAAAATVHTIIHNLNSLFVDVKPMVEREDGGYYNDVVCVKEIDANTHAVYLTSAQKLKVIARRADAL